MASTRKDTLSTGQYYHIFSRSIAKFEVFKNNLEFSRIIDLIDLCRFKDFNYRYSKFKSLESATQDLIIKEIKASSKKIVEIIAYCIMPTHIHLILKQLEDVGISKFMSKILDSYSKSFNTWHKRTGPLWSSAFKNVLISSDEQMLHLTRYIHLNPSSVDLVKNPEDWDYSSYHEYINGEIKSQKNICDIGDLFDITPKQYKEFVGDRKKYQREISIIKSILIDDYTG